MATTYEAIATVTVGSGGAASMAFSSIPATYTDLVVKASVRDVSSTTTPALKMVINGDTASNYSYRLLYGTGSSAASLSGTIGYTYNGAVDTTNETASTFANAEIYIPNYAGSNKKSLSTDSVTENNATGVVTALVANLWDNTSAITSLTLSSVGGNFAQYSTATLYGIKNS